MAVGGIVVVDEAGVDFADSDGELVFDPSLAWPNGVPVSVRAHGHFDKTLVAQVSMRCERTEEAVAACSYDLEHADSAEGQQYRQLVERDSVGVFMSCQAQPT